MSVDLSDRIRRLLHNTESELDSIGQTDEESIFDSISGSELDELVDVAGALIADTDTQDFLEELGFGEPTATPDSIPVAIATGDEEPVRNLRAVLLLSNLSIDDDTEIDAESLQDQIQGLRESVESINVGAANDDGEKEAAEDGKADTEEASDAGPSEEESSGEQIRSAMESAIGDLREEIGGVDDLADEVTEGIDSDAEGIRETVGLGDDDEQEGEGEAGAGDDDDGFLGSDDSTSRRGRLSTLPRQPRPDMKAVKRHSTMPDR